MKSKSVKEIKEIIEDISTDKYLEYIDILKNDKLKLLSAVRYARLSKCGRSESKIWNIATRTTIIVARIDG